MAFPPPQLADEDGLLAIGGDLSVGRLLAAYRAGIFPWFGEDDPILWWSPDPRSVLFPDKLRVSKSLRRSCRSSQFRITFDTAFDRVVRACAAIPRPGQADTWITPQMIAAYEDLHREGYAHSVETWRGDDLVGGLYGVALGRCFFGESMFSRISNASKVAFVRLVEVLRRGEYPLIDCQVHNQHLASLGAEEIPREHFLGLLNRALEYETERGIWVGKSETKRKERET